MGCRHIFNPPRETITPSSTFLFSFPKPLSEPFLLGYLTLTLFSYFLYLRTPPPLPHPHRPNYSTSLCLSFYRCFYSLLSFTYCYLNVYSFFLSPFNRLPFLSLSFCIFFPLLFFLSFFTVVGSTRIPRKICFGLMGSFRRVDSLVRLKTHALAPCDPWIQWGRGWNKRRWPVKQYK